jgi:hypothetical protein
MANSKNHFTEYPFLEGKKVKVKTPKWPVDMGSASKVHNDERPRKDCEYSYLYFTYRSLYVHIFYMQHHAHCIVNFRSC